jgi:ABC-type glycerol-3-phosphate transport system substrate-binding protein
MRLQNVLNRRALMICASLGALSACASRPARVTASAPPPAPPSRVEIVIIHGHEKTEWLDAATRQFHASHPDIAVKLIAKSSLASAEAILEGTEQPTLFSPADSTALDLLAEDWADLHRSALFAPPGPDAPRPLLLTPLVFVGWQDRIDALLKPDGVISWQSLHRALAAGNPKDDRERRLQGVPGLRLGHSEPDRSNSGFQTLLSLTLDYFGRDGFRRDDLLRPKYQEFVENIERGVVRGGQPYGGTLMADMVRFGPAKYDVAVVYESLAITNLAMGESRWGKLKVSYPATTIWSDNPIALLQGAWVTEPQKAAARLFIDHLRSQPMQELAMRFGFRPAEPSVPLRSDDPNNPFVRLASKGIRQDVPPSVDRPDTRTVRALLGTWAHVAPHGDVQGSSVAQR